MGTLAGGWCSCHPSGLPTSHEGTGNVREKHLHISELVLTRPVLGHCVRGSAPGLLVVRDQQNRCPLLIMVSCHLGLTRIQARATAGGANPAIPTLGGSVTPAPGDPAAQFYGPSRWVAELWEQTCPHPRSSLKARKCPELWRKEEGRQFQN